MNVTETICEKHTENNLGVGEQLFPVVVTNTRKGLALSGALVAAAATVILSIWSTGLEAMGISNAVTWGIGIVLLGLAVDNRGKTALFQTASGLLLMMLALLQSFVSAEFLIGSGALIASWVAMFTYRQLYLCENMPKR